MDTFTPWTIVVDLGIISALMLLGKLIRVKVKGIQKFLIPPAVPTGEPPITIRMRDATDAAPVRFSCGIVANPAVLVVTDWKRDT